MTDVITIRDLRVETHIGVTEAERKRAQTVVISIDIEADLASAGASDSIEDTIDYDTVATRIADLVRTSDARLLEHLAERIATTVLAFDRVNGVSVEISKERPPIDEDVGAVVVTIERERE